MQRTGENDLHEPRGDDYGYNEGTICLVSELIGDKRMVFERGRTNGRQLAVAGTQDGGADFFPLLGY